MLAVVAMGTALGQWQTGRANMKLAMQHDMDVRSSQAPVVLDASMDDIAAMQFRPAIAAGRFVPEWTIYLENRPHQGRAGFYVVTPLQLDDHAGAVLVLRGWIPRDVADRTRIASYTTPAGPLRIDGLVRVDAGKVLQLGTAGMPAPGAIMQNLDIGLVQAASGLPLLPYVLAQTGGDDDGLVRDWPLPATGVDKHRGYAVQWYGLALTAFVFFIVTGFRRGKK